MKNKNIVIGLICVIAVVIIVGISVPKYMTSQEQNQPETVSPTPAPEVAQKQTPENTPIVEEKAAEKPEEMESEPAAPVVVARNALSGIIQAEDYDAGGEGIGFHDTTPGNRYEKYRDDGVDIESWGKDEYSIGGVAAGEWVAYTVDSLKAGQFDIDVQSATPSQNMNMHIEVNGKNVSGTIPIPVTGSWSKFETFTIPSIELAEGAQQIKFVFDTGFLNFDWFKIVPLMSKWEGGGEMAVRALWLQGGKPASDVDVSIKGEIADKGRWRSMIKTNKEGMATLPFPDGAEKAHLSATHRHAKAVEIKDKPLIDGDTYTITLERLTSMFGAVMLAGRGEPVEGATVELLGTGLSVTTGVAGEWEIFNIPNTKVRPIAQKDNLVSYKNADDIPTHQLISGEHNGPFDMLLKEGPLFSGTVVDGESGEPVKEATISMQMEGGDIRKSYDAKSDELGTFTIVGLFGNRYRVNLKADGYVAETLFISLSPDPIQARTFKMEPGAKVNVLVEDSEGQPISGASMRIIRGYQWDTPDIDTDDKGKAVVPNISRKDPPKITAFKRGYSYSDQVQPTFKPDEWETSIKLVMNPQEETENNQEDKEPGIFVGKVTDSEDNPIAGATLTWRTPWNTNQDFGTAETDAEGKYRLETKADGNNQGNQMALIAEAEGYAPAWKMDITPGTAVEPRQVDLKLESGHFIEVLVVDEDDSPISDVTVNIRANSNDYMQHYNIPGLDQNQKTDASGRLRVENVPGPTVNINITKTGWSSVWNQASAVDKETKIVMLPTGVIIGRVLDKETKEPISDFKIHVKGNYISTDRSESGDLFSDPEGRFKVEGLQLQTNYTSNYSLNVVAEGYAPQQEQNIPPMREKDAKERVIYLSRGGSTIIKVTYSESGEPIPGAPVVAAFPNSQYGNYINVNWDNLTRQQMYNFTGFEKHTTDDSGQIYLVEGDSKFTLFITAPGRANKMIKPEERSFVKGEGEDSDIYMVTMEPEGSISGVYSRNGEPISGSNISLGMSEHNSYYSYGNKQTDSSGQYRHDGLQAGNFTLSIQTVKNNMGFSIASKRVSLEAGEHKTVNLGEDFGPHALYGKIRDDGQPLVRCNVQLTPKFTSEYTSFTDYTDGEGNYRIEGLQPGQYSINLNWNSNTGQDRRNYQDVITIEADTEWNYDFGKQYKVVAKLVFPEDLPAEVKARYYHSNISFKGNHSEARSEGIATYGNCQIVDDKIEFKGKYKGTYDITLQLRQTQGNQISTITLPGPFELDDTESDQDLGEIVVPIAGSVRFRFVYERPEDKDLYNAANLAWAGTGNWYNQPNPDGITFNGGTSIVDSIAVFSGRFKGDYRLTLSSGQDQTSARVQIPQLMQIQNPDIDTNMGDIVVPAVYELRGRLIFSDAEQKSAYGRINFNRKNFTQELQNEGIAINAQGTINADGTFSIRQRMQGSYTITLAPLQYGGGMSQLVLPDEYVIDTLTTDQDLGDITIQPSGKVTVNITHTDPTKMPQYMAAMIVGTEGNPNVRSQIQMDTSKDTQDIGPVPSGEQTLQFVAPGFKAEPGEATVYVDPENKPQVDITLTPIGVIFGYVMGVTLGPEGESPVKEITLEGNGISRSLVPTVPGDENVMMSIYTSGEDGAVLQGANVMFAFNNLDAGTYTVRITADGYETYESERTVEPGRIDESNMQITLKKTE